MLTVEPLVSNALGRARTIASLAVASSAGVAPSDASRATSFRISATAGAVASVRTPD